LSVTVKPEGFHERCIAPVSLTVATCDGISHSLLWVEFSTLLVVIANSHRRANINGARSGLQPTRHNIEQGRLSCPIWANNTQPLSVIEQQLNIAKQVDAWGIAMRDLVKLDDSIP
jgi:hypothetical protein